MSNEIMDIKKWKGDYPFLTDVWNKIEDFGKDVEEDQNISKYISTCSFIINPWSEGEEKYKNFCIKLVRNLGYHSNNDFLDHTSERCNNLNNWIYSSMKKLGIPENIITGCFYHYDVFMRGITQYPRCTYYSYDKDYNEPINIIKLQNFHHNVKIIHDILINESTPKAKNSHYCYAQRYANECVKIYRNMHARFCSGDKSLIPSNEKTCSELKTFKRIYTNYLFNQGDINKKIPNLSSSENEKHFLCPLDEPSSGLDLTQGLGRAEGLGGVQEMMSESGSGHRSVSVGTEQPANPAPLNSTAVVGTMIGIPPFLGLIYRFTPIGTMFRSKNKKSINVFNNLNEEIENELFYSRLENANVNYSPERYNVAYGRV